MSKETNDSKPTDMDALKQPSSACGPECGCHATGTSGRTRWVIGAVVLVAAAALVVRAVTKDSGADEKTATGFADPTITAQTPAPTTNGPAASSGTVIGKEIATFAELNTIATNMDGVFLYLPGKSGSTGKAPAAQIMGAVKTIEAQGRKIGVFTLKPDSGDYTQIATQVAVPAVIALVKGRGMAPVSGDITETKIVQAFVKASSAGGCGPASGGCGPASGGCK